MKLSKRLLAIYLSLDLRFPIYDLGCDHCLLAEYHLSQGGQAKFYSIDILKHIIDRERQRSMIGVSVFGGSAFYKA